MSTRGEDSVDVYARAVVAAEAAWRVLDASPTDENRARYDAAMDRVYAAFGKIPRGRRVEALLRST